MRSFLVRSLALAVAHAGAEPAGRGAAGPIEWIDVDTTSTPISLFSGLCLLTAISRGGVRQRFVCENGFSTESNEK